MKKVNLLLAAVVAASVSAPALAEYTPNAHFFGYFRAGIGFDKNGSANSYQVGEVGRLGNENNMVAEIGIGTDIAKVDDTVWTINSMLKSISTGTDVHGKAYGYDVNNSWDNGTSGASSKTGYQNEAETFISQFNVEVKGLLSWDKDALVWAGRRYVQREDIHLTDDYYYNISGNGIGVENVSLGSGKWSIAATQLINDRVHNTYQDNNRQKTNCFDTRYNFPLWDGASFQIGELFSYIKSKKAGAHTKNGNTVTLEFIQGFSGGFNKTVYQWMLGASAVGLAVESWDNNYEGAAVGHKLYNFGDFKITDSFGLAHAIKLTYQTKSDIGDGDFNQKGFSVVLRPYYALTMMTRLLVEVGAFGKYNETNKDSGKVKSYQRGQKATIAYAITPDAKNFWSRPEIRLFATWVHSPDENVTSSAYSYRDPLSETGLEEGKTNFVVGAQVESWF